MQISMLQPGTVTLPGVNYSWLIDRISKSVTRDFFDIGDHANRPAELGLV
jgi:hypothetical protein